jgi:hypothetical protein
MTAAEIQPKVPAFVQAKTVHALDRMATVTGMLSTERQLIIL